MRKSLNHSVTDLFNNTNSWTKWVTVYMSESLKPSFNWFVHKHWFIYGTKQVTLYKRVIKSFTYQICSTGTVLFRNYTNDVWVIHSRFTFCYKKKLIHSEMKPVTVFFNEWIIKSFTQTICSTTLIHSGMKQMTGNMIKSLNHLFRRFLQTVAAFTWTIIIRS